MQGLEHPPEVQNIDQMLAHADEVGALPEGVGSTVDKLRGELETIAVVLRKPLPSAPFEAEPECARAVELASGVASSSGPDSVNVRVGRVIDPTAELGQIGPYKLLELLGQGGMGAVYKALHPRLEKIVALKILRTARVQKDVLDRFDREMKALGKIDHPHLIRAMDAGEVDGTRYLVMEFISGMDLSNLLATRGKLKIADACVLITQAAAGLHAAHSRGMIHRDIKPANLMLAEQEFGPPIVKVLDLGLALLSETQTPNAGGLTSDGQIMGTIDYMPPEQAQDSHTVDERADIYSLGASLYALLTGGSIFSGRPNATLMQKLMTLATEPIPPIRERRPDVSEPLTQIVHRMLARDPKQRFASMTEVIAALKPFAVGADLSALLNPLQHDAPASGSFDASAQSIATVCIEEDDQSLTGLAGGTLVTAEISRNARASGSSVVASSEPDSRAFRLMTRTRTAIAVAIAGVVLLGAILLSLKTPDGEVIVEIPDDLPAEVRKEIKISVTGDGAAEVASEANGWKIGIKEGRYSIELSGGSDRVLVKDKQVTVTRRKKSIVTITLKPLGEMAAKTTSDKPADPDRQFAEWLKSIHPSVLFEVTLADGAIQRVHAQDPLPTVPFRVHFLFLEGAQFDPQDDAFLKEFTNRVKGLRITGLSLHSPTLTSDRVARFTQLPELSGLTTLMITSDMVDDSVFPALARIPNLRFVDFRCPRITGKGLGTLRRLTNLALLNAKNSSVEGLAELQQLQLDYLQIGGFRFTNQHVEAFAKLKLRRLQTDDAGIDDAMAARFANIDGLEVLNFNNSPITDQGLPELKRLKNLTRLFLTKTKVTATGVADLQKALPNCKIEWDAPKE